MAVAVLPPSKNIKNIKKRAHKDADELYPFSCVPIFNLSFLLWQIIKCFEFVALRFPLLD